MDNYAIVLGVDKYKNADELSCCNSDAQLMEGFLSSTGKYKVLRIPNDANKHQVQEAISDFLPEEGTEVGEVLFYFSGHGKQDALGMHYALSDTDVARINSTAFNNTELDNIVRKYSPKLFVKIIDACQSGVAYIKGIEETTDVPETIQAKDFENCIFLFSSLKTQSSYTGNPYSKFTKAVVDAVESTPTNTVKFSDIQNYLSDVFKVEGGNQTPYFNTQCDGTEVFCEKNDAVIKFLTALRAEVVVTDNISQPNILSIKQYLKKCRSDDDVKVLMEKVHRSLAEWKQKSALLSEFYGIECKSSFPHEYHKYLEDKSLVKMLYSRVSQENLFVEVECSSVKKQNPLIESIFSGFTETPVSFSSLVNQLPSIFSIHFKASDINLPDYVVPFIFVYSPTFFYVFTCAKQFVRKGWKEYESAQHTKYVYTKFEYDTFTEMEWKDYQEKRLDEAIDFIEKTLLEYTDVK